MKNLNVYISSHSKSDDHYLNDSDIIKNAHALESTHLYLWHLISY